MRFKIPFLKILVAALVIITATILIQSFRLPMKESISIPDDAVLSFSYDLKVESYAQLENEQDREKLRPHEKFQFVPKSEKMHVQGYLRSDGFPHIEIDVLEKSTKPWLRKTLSSSDNEIKAKELKKLIIDNGRFTAFDDRGEKIYEKAEPLFNFKEKADFFLKNLDAEKAYKEMVANLIKKGAEVRSNGEFMNINFDMNGLNFNIEMLQNYGLPTKSVVKSEKEVTTTNYTFECIDGKWVLVITKTKIEPNRDNPDLTDQTPVINNFITELENVNISIL